MFAQQRNAAFGVWLMDSRMVLTDRYPHLPSPATLPHRGQVVARSLPPVCGYDVPARSFSALPGPAPGRTRHGLGHHCFKLNQTTSLRADGLPMIGRWNSIWLDPARFIWPLGYRPASALTQPRPAHRQQDFWRNPPCWSTCPVPLQSGHSTLAGRRPWLPVGISLSSLLTCS